MTVTAAACARRMACRKDGVEDDQRRLARHLSEAADRFNDLADVAELMGDDDGAARFRAQALSRRMQAMSVLDD